jgi:hypothetical protein
MICPVCLAEILLDGGVVATHRDSTGRRWCPMSGKEPFVWTERATRIAVPGRSGGRCEYCWHKATNMAHRKNVSQGGLWSPANVLHLCGSGTIGCHGYFTHHPTEAYRLGVNVHRDEEPAQIPVRTPNGLLWLSDDICPPLPGWAP